MLNNTAGITFKYADDSEILVITDNQSTTCLTVEQNLNAVENWCRRWRIQLNGTKAEIVPINLDGKIPVFNMRGEKCKLNYDTKIPGLTIDDSFSFKTHAEKITARCKGRWKEMGIHCKKKWGLSRNTLVLLYKSLVLPTLLYWAPVWANQNIKKLESFQSFINRDVLETRYYPNSMATEVLLGIPPIDNVVQNISAKFLTKVLHYQDHLTKRVIQKQKSLTFITTQRNIMKQFYNLKYIDLSEDHSFTVSVSRSHILHRWNSRWLYPDFATHLKSLVHRVDIDPMLMKVNATKQVMRTTIELLLDINPSINKFAYNRSLTVSPLCPCKETEETATHLLFDCTIYEARNRPGKNFNLYDLRDCVNLIELRHGNKFAPISSGHGNKFEPVSSNFYFEWTKFEFSKNRNKLESLCSKFGLSIKRATDITPFHLVPRVPLGPLMFPSC